ncbi:Septin-7 [Nymphon striatum]|nr:Septin-7 [Nymphon striatum]
MRTKTKTAGFNKMVQQHMCASVHSIGQVFRDRVIFRSLWPAQSPNLTRPDFYLWGKNPLAQMEDEKKEHDDKIKRMEQDMENVFEMKVKEKKQKLKDSETDVSAAMILQKRHEQMKKSLEQQQKELDDKKKTFIKEKETFEFANKDLEEMFRKNTLENSKEAEKNEILCYPETSLLQPVNCEDRNMLDQSSYFHGGQGEKERKEKRIILMSCQVVNGLAA